MTWLRKPPTLSHHSTRFCVYRSCGSGNEKFPICQVKLCDQVSKGHIIWCVAPPQPKSPLYQVSCLLVLEKWKHNIFNSSCNYMTKGTYALVRGSPSTKVTIVPDLMLLSLVEVEI